MTLATAPVIGLARSEAISTDTFAISASNGSLFSKVDAANLASNSCHDIPALAACWSNTCDTPGASGEPDERGKLREYHAALLPLLTGGKNPR